jgi:hypothetical protein
VFLTRQHEFSLAQTSPQRERFLSYPISVRTLVEKILDMRKQYVYHYPRFYRLVNSISLDHRSIVSTSLSTSKLTLQHLRTLLKKVTLLLLLLLRSILHSIHLYSLFSTFDFDSHNRYRENVICSIAMPYRLAHEFQ